MNKTGLKRRVCIRRAEAITPEGKKINILIIPNGTNAKNDPRKQNKKRTPTVTTTGPKTNPPSQAQAAAALEPPDDVNRQSSKSSVIYVDSFDNANCPIIDLTESSSTIMDTPSSVSNKIMCNKTGNSRQRPSIISQRNKRTPNMSNNNTSRTNNNSCQNNTNKSTTKPAVIRTNSLLTRQQYYNTSKKIRVIPSKNVRRSPPLKNVLDDALDLQSSYAERCLEGVNVSEPFFNTKIPLDTIMNSYGVTTNDTFNDI